jgi:hypothetical protein
MPRGGVSGLAKTSRSVLLALWLAAPAHAQNTITVPEGQLTFHSAAEIELLAKSGAAGFDSGFRGSVAERSAYRRLLRTTPLAFRAGELREPAGELPHGPALYGVLAGRALLSALALGGKLPLDASPWFDGNPDQMTAGFEFSF